MILFLFLLFYLFVYLFIILLVLLGYFQYVFYVEGLNGHIVWQWCLFL